jgi:hypothetical protein
MLRLHSFLSLSTLFLQSHLDNVQQPQGRQNHRRDPHDGGTFNSPPPNPTRDGDLCPQASSTDEIPKVCTPCCVICFFQSCLVSMPGVNMIMYKHRHRHMLQLLTQWHCHLWLLFLNLMLQCIAQYVETDSHFYA